MLSAQSFMTGMEMLKKCYIGWQFDTKDEMQVNLWYSVFKSTTDEQFMSIVKEYIARNDYPPKCIKNLTDILVDKALGQAKIPPERALHYVKDVISDCGGWEYGGRTDIYRKLEKYPALSKTVKEFEATIQTMRSDDTYTADRFRKAYEQNLRDAATTRVDLLLGIKVPENSQIFGQAALPYET